MKFRLRHWILATVLVEALLSPAARAGVLFSEPFDYSVGANLANQNGGTGFSGAWGAGNSTIVAGLGGSGNAVQIGSSIAARSLSAPTSTSGTSFYLTYLMNASDFSAGNYTGLSLWNSSTEEMFLGIPWNAGSFGFDAHAGNGSADIKTVNFTPSTNTTYLIAFGLVPSATSGKVDVKMWATSNLGVDPTALVAGAANASLDGVKSNFTFDTLKVAGNYAGSLKVAGFAASPAISEATQSTVLAVPEPATWAIGLVGIVGAGWGALRRSKRAKGLEPSTSSLGS